MSKKLIFATTNEGKMKEIRMILADLGMEILSLKDLEITVDIEENGKTFEENAVIKAKAISELTGEMVLADDSGLEVDYMDKAPGVYSARYAGVHGDYEANNKKLLEKLNGVKEKDRTAKFVSAISCALPDGTEFTVIGECCGKIAFDVKGENGFAFDRVFISSIGRFSEISPEQKDSISHRYVALKEFEKKLKELNL